MGFGKVHAFVRCSTKEVFTVSGLGMPGLDGLILACRFLKTYPA